MKKDISHEYLLSILKYNPETGIFTWKVNRGTYKCKGRKAGCINNCGYIHITIFGKKYMGHVLAWLYMTGEWPIEQIDHENRIKTDNRFDNLRPANSSLQGANQIKHKNNQTGYKGVSLKLGKYYRAQIAKDGKTYHLGSFSTPEEASKAYTLKAKELFGEFSHN